MGVNIEYARKAPGDYLVRWDGEPPRMLMCIPGIGRIPVVSDASMPSNCFELRSGDQRLRVRWPDPATEIDRWADDGGRAP